MVKTRKQAGLVCSVIAVFFFAGARMEAEESAASTSPEAAALTTEDAAASAAELYKRGDEARRNQYWDKVIELWSEGEKLFPEDSRFSEGLGDIYAGRELFRLAKEAYQKALRIKPDDGALLFKLAAACGSLNEDRQAARYLERLLAQEPDNREGIALLGWMYFKLHRLTEGKALVTAAMERLGPSADLLMMLATINSDLLDYNESQNAYEQAIALSARSGDTGFAAIANYNYSILESRFYHFDRARELAALSLEMSGRPSGHLALGELLLRRLDWKSGLAEYQTAFEMDRSPLSKLSLADAYRACGRLEEARSYAEDCLKRSNHAWMLNYGIGIHQYKRDVHEILYKVYSGLYQTERFTPAANPLRAFQSVWKKSTYFLRALAHKKLFYKYALASGNSFSNTAAAAGADAADAADAGGAGGVSGASDDAADDGAADDAADDGAAGSGTNGGRALPDTLIQYYYAFGAYPSRAFTYAVSARKTETPKIPASASVYMFYEGSLKKDKNLLLTALAGFDPLWEKDMLADTLVELCSLPRPAGEYAENLYLANPGALRQNGIRLPVRIEIEGGAPGLRRKLNACGFKDTGSGRGGGGGGGSAARFILRVRADGGSGGGLNNGSADSNGGAVGGGSAGGLVFFEFFDSARGFALLRDSVLSEGEARSAAGMAQAIAAKVFAVR